MSGAVAQNSEHKAADPLLAAQFFVNDPIGFGGLVLHGFGPVRDRLVSQIVDRLRLSRPVVKIPINVDADQLDGGVDIAETLASGRAVRRAGLVERARGGVAVVPMVERMSANVAAHLAQAIDRKELAVILLDDGMDQDETPPGPLMERASFHCDLSQLRDLTFELSSPPDGVTQARGLLKAQRSAIASTAGALGVYSIRPILFVERCARALAESNGQSRVCDDDLAAAIRLVLAPRARKSPELQEPQEPEQSADNEPAPNEDETANEKNPAKDIPLDDLLLQEAEAAIPQHILDGLSETSMRSQGGVSGRSGQKEKSGVRGRPRGSLPGRPGDGRKLALIDTLRAAAPWQTIRLAQAGDQGADRLQIRTSDLRIRQYEQNRESLTIFAVDASGSSALSRLAEAKGAIELMLAEAHVKRSQVALIAFRHSHAEVLLPPTRSLTRARRSLAALPGGGGTPLAAGLLEARLLADAAERRGQTPTIALLTDGKANVTLAGEADRNVAMQEASDIASGLAAAGYHSIVIDIAPRPRDEAAALAQRLRGKYLPLPYANSAAMVAAIETLSADSTA